MSILLNGQTSSSLKRTITVLGFVGVLFHCDEPIDEIDEIGGIDDWADDSVEFRAGGEDVIFESTSLLLANIPLTTIKTGNLDMDEFQNAARPWTGDDPDYIYGTESWYGTSNGLVATRGFRVTRRERTDVIEPQSFDVQPPKVSEGLMDALEGSTDPAEMFDVAVRLAEFPPWDIPVRPNSSILSPSVVNQTNAARAAALVEREEIYEDLVATHLSEDRLAGGSIRHTLPLHGWVGIRVSRTVLLEMTNDPAFSNILDAHVATLDDDTWTLGEARHPGRLDVDRFHTNNATGGIANPDRHNVGNLLIGILETMSLEDEACAWFDGANCAGNTRLIDKFSCADSDMNGIQCEVTQDLLDEENSPENNVGGHGTAVAAAAAGDYQDDQGCGQKLGDTNWVNGCHSSDWERKASGIAPEASIAFSGEFAAADDVMVTGQAAAHLLTLAPDVVNASFGQEILGQECDIQVETPLEEVIEDMYDDGVFVAASAVDSDGGQGCIARAPGDMLTTFAVNAYGTTGLAPCDTNTWGCRGGNGLGGADAIIAGMVRPGVISVVDSTGPGQMFFQTGLDGVHGAVKSNDAFVQGTSISTPVIAGMATILKDSYLARGMKSINDPGELHTAMLAMADRHRRPSPNDSILANTIQRVVGSDTLYGLGRAKLRFIDPTTPNGPWKEHHVKHHFQPGDGPFSYFAFSPPSTKIPLGVTHVKCVLHQHEDMSEKDDISALGLQVRLLPGTGPGEFGPCNPNGGSFLGLDVSLDNKKMVGFGPQNVFPIGNRCLLVTVFPLHISSKPNPDTPGVTANVMCYYSGQDDDESHCFTGSGVDCTGP